VFAACLPLYGGEEPSRLLGGGEPGLHIVFGRKSTNQYALYLDEPWTIGSGLIGGYDKRHIEVLLDHSYGLKEKIQARGWGDGPDQLYPFDDETAFTYNGESIVYKGDLYIIKSLGYQMSPDGKSFYIPRRTQVFSIKGDGIVVANDVYALACARYGLTTNQLFLGKIGTNVYYWEKQDPRKVYYRPASGERATNYFEFPKGILDFKGVTRGIKERENIGFAVLRKSKGFFHYSPNEFAFIEVSFKDAKQMKGNQ
jgi:hypothetical protein